MAPTRAVLLAVLVAALLPLALSLGQGRVHGHGHAALGGGAWSSAHATFYGGGAHGYTDYPEWTEEKAAAE